MFAERPRQPAPRSCLVPLAADHDAVPIGRAKSKLPHAPRFVAQHLTDLRPRCNDGPIVFVNIVDHQIAEGAVVAKLPCWDGIGAFASHDLTADDGVQQRTGQGHGQGRAVRSAGRR